MSSRALLHPIPTPAIGEAQHTAFTRFSRQNMVIFEICLHPIFFLMFSKTYGSTFYSSVSDILWFPTTLISIEFLGMFKIRELKEGKNLEMT